jgi:hypothetical protein
MSPSRLFNVRIAPAVDPLSLLLDFESADLIGSLGRNYDARDGMNRMAIYFGIFFLADRVDAALTELWAA